MLALRWEHFAKPRLSQTAFLVKHFADQVNLSKEMNIENVKRDEYWAKPSKENGKRLHKTSKKMERDRYLLRSSTNVMAFCTRTGTL